MHNSSPRPAHAALACALACLALPAAARGEAYDVKVTPAGLMMLHAVLFIFALGLLVLCIFYLRQRRSLSIERKRFSVMLGNSFESVAELDLTDNLWLDYHILNGFAEKTRMPETLDAYLERFVRERVYREDAETFQRAFQMESLRRLSTDNLSVTINIRLKAPSNRLYWCALLAQGVSAQSKTHATVMLYIRNIDAGMRASQTANERMADALRLAERHSRIKSDFLSRISHEIRTPLNAIMGFLAIARQSGDVGPKALYALDKVDAASRRLLSLVNDMLDISAIEKNELRTENQPFHLRECVENLGSSAFEQARGKGLHFAAYLDDVEDEYLVGDLSRLNQILTYLIDNAIRFTPSGGHVSLTVRQAARKDDSVFLRFLIADDGVGMKEGYEDRIFSLFAQENQGEAKPQQSPGLGLSLVKNMVEAMGGSITAQSKLGEGSAFTVSLPFALNRFSVPDEQKRRAYGNLNALLVDDSQTTLEYESLLLKKLGVAHSLAISGEVALRKAHAARDAGTPYTLYLIDWAMPDLSGAETIRRLLSEVDCEARIAVLTDIAAAAAPAQAEGLPILGMAAKPLFQSSLVDLLTNVLGRQSTTEEDCGEAGIYAGNRALLAEDNELNREIALDMLGSLGLEADVTADGQTAFETFVAKPAGYYQAVLMDIQMPVMDGYDATKAIRASAHADAKTVPIIAMTANAFPEDITRSLAAGMDDHLSKPIDLATLRQTLRKYLHKRQC